MILLDAVVAALLFASIIFSLKLNNSINKLKESRREIAASVMEFSGALSKAEESITRLKSLNSEVGGQLQDNIDRARFLANDLSFLIQKGNEVSDRLEGNVSLHREGIVKSSLPLLNSGAGGRAGEFNKRASKIAEGQVSGIYDNVISAEDSSYNNKGLARKYAMEQALEQLARKNLAKIKMPEASRENIAEEAPGKTRQRRLFDALKWGRQLNG